MFKTLFNIVLILIGLGTAAHASDIQLLSSELQHSINIESSGEIHKLSTSQHLFFNLQTVDRSIVSNSEIKLSQPDEISIEIFGILHRSNHVSTLQHAQFNRYERDNFRNLHLRETLFPFHSFW